MAQMSLWMQPWSDVIRIPIRLRGIRIRHELDLVTGNDICEQSKTTLEPMKLLSIQTVQV